MQARATQDAEGEQAVGLRDEPGGGEPSPAPAGPAPPGPVGEHRRGLDDFRATFEKLMAGEQQNEELQRAFDAQAQENQALREQLAEERQVQEQLHELLANRQTEIEHLRAQVATPFRLANQHPPARAQGQTGGRRSSCATLGSF